MMKSLASSETFPQTVSLIRNQRDCLIDLVLKQSLYQRSLLIHCLLKLLDRLFESVCSSQASLLLVIAFLPAVTKNEVSIKV